ncbi:unnamed protein product [Trichobilharzia szidati]|nr:unnamed protein product [Trichobilharzia szidati]
MDTLNSDEFSTEETADDIQGEDGEIGQEGEEQVETHEEITTRSNVYSRILVLHDLMREHIGLKRDAKITPAFVWSYFELLKQMKRQVQPSAVLDQVGEDSTNSSINITV